MESLIKKFNVKDFREILGYGRNKKETIADKIAELAEYDDVSIDEAIYRIDMAESVLEPVWYYMLKTSTNASDVFDHYLSKYNAFDWYFKNAEQEYMRTFKYLSGIDFDGSILDLGGGNGYFSLVASALGYDITYNDMSVESVKFVQWKIDKLASSLRVAVDIEDETFDCICAFDVAEHFQNIDVFIATIEKYSIIGGQTHFIATTSFSSRSAGHFSIYKYGDEIIPAESATGLFRAEMKKKYEKVYFPLGWNERPAIWKIIRP